MLQPYDLPLEKLQQYKPDFTKQPDFDTFWADTLNELSQVKLQYTLTPYDYPVKGIKVYIVSFIGFNNANIEGIYAVPEGDGQYPGLMLYHGYNWAADGCIHDVVNWALKGYAVFHMQVRGQQGYSSDNVVSSTGGVSGWMTKGLLDKNEYYYRAVYMDSVRALEVLADMKEVDAKRIGVLGGSQGGALTLAAAALSSIPVVALADYPYLSHFNRAIDICPNGPYNELNEFFRRNTKPAIEIKAKETLSYFDIMNLADRIKCHTWVSIGLVDDITPPSTVFAVYNHLLCSKEISVQRYFGHEFMSGTVEEKLTTLMKYLQGA